jgi:hypothetical protein
MAVRSPQLRVAPSLSMRRARLELGRPRVSRGREGLDSARGADGDGDVTATAELSRGRTTNAADEELADGITVSPHQIG